MKKTIIMAVLSMVAVSGSAIAAAPVQTQIDKVNERVTDIHNDSQARDQNLNKYIHQIGKTAERERQVLTGKVADARKHAEKHRKLLNGKLNTRINNTNTKVSINTQELLATNARIDVVNEINDKQSENLGYLQEQMNTKASKQELETEIEELAAEAEKHINKVNGRVSVVDSDSRVRDVVTNKRIDVTNTKVDSNTTRITAAEKELYSTTARSISNEKRISKVEVEVAGLKKDIVRLDGMVASQQAANSIILPSNFNGNIAVGVGVGHYRGSNGLAIGVVHDGGDYAVKATVSGTDADGWEDLAYGVSVNFTF